VRLLEATFATSSKAQMNSWRKPNLGYGPGLQQPKQMANEHYSTLQGNYNACTREDFIFVNPDAAVRKRDGDPYVRAKRAQRRARKRVALGAGGGASAGANFQH
jgi:hypothetical protein